MLLIVMGKDTRTAHDGVDGVEQAEAFRPYPIDEVLGRLPTEYKERLETVELPSISSA